LKLKVLFVASECVPFSKTGGLADVVGALPKEIKKSGVDVRVITPLYSAIPEKWRSKMEHLLYFYVNLGWRRQYVGIEKLTMNDITYYFVDNEYYFGRSYIYGLGGDEGERFAFFDRAVMEALPKIDFVPDVLHCHDWQTGLIPAMLEIQYRVLKPYQKIKSVYTVHNLQYQGVFPIDQIEELVSLGALAYTPDHLEFYGQCNFMKGGLTFSQKITTVSPTYAEEVKTAYYGERLDGLMRARSQDLLGILNGIDTEEYDPLTDPLIEERFGPESLERKLSNKLALQRELGLQEGADIPLVGMVGRLSSQKGLDLVERVLDGVMATGCQLAVLGMGEDRYVDLFNWAQWKYAGRIASRIEMNHTLAHRIYAGADMFLMPSMFEPCGLSQMISMRYGTLPVVRETGGLRDTVLSYNEFSSEGNGFTFLNYNAHDMLHVLERAVNLYKDHPDAWKRLMERAMRGLYGWDQSAHHYVDLYRELAKPARKPKAPKEAPAAPEASAEPAAPEPAPVEPLSAQPVIVVAMSAESLAAAEALVPEAAAETPAPEAPAKPAKKPRAKKAAPEVAEAPADEAPVKPAKKSRSKKAAAEPAPEVVAEPPKPAKKPRAKKAKE
jgi:starch synthase